MDDTLANKIAAGEVVQRPASAAKELIENALDAGARSVSLILRAAGSELIQVVDDGCGMSPGDAQTCFQRHATSKIRSIDDLDCIRTLGFRGEALASIASVAQVELRTKRRTDAAGLRVVLHGGTVHTAEPCATPDGTSVAVRNLFYNVPARRNFLKTPATEFKHLVETFQFLALAHPGVAFRLVHDEHEVYRLSTPGTANRMEALRVRIRELFGDDYLAHLVPVEETTSYLSIEGFVTTAEKHRRSRGEQFLFVNDRYVKHRSLEHAVASAYEASLPEGAYPFFALFLDLDPSHTDVNVHPTKAEIKFDDDRGVYAFVQSVVKKALAGVNLTPQFGDRPGEGAARASSRRTVGSLSPEPTPAAFQARATREAAPRGPSPASFAPASSGRPGAPARRTIQKELGEWNAAFYGTHAPAPDAEIEETVASGVMRDVEEPLPLEEADALLVQLSNRYILTQIRSGIMVVDQQAAHERILYERALGAMDGGIGASQQLLFPHTLTLSPSDHTLLRELLPDLKALGFDLEFFSGRSVVVRGVPQDIGAGDERAVLDEVLEQYKSYAGALQLKRRENIAKSVAHRAAVHSGARMSTSEMRALIDRLFQCEMPYASPHGRPTMIKISMEELDRRFGT